MDNLSKSIYRVVEPIVKSVDENKDLASAGLFCDRGDSGHKALFIGIVRRNGHEVRSRVAGKRRGPLNLADLA